MRVIEERIVSLESFLDYLDTDTVIKHFLDYDKCYRLADSYLIAVTFIYFERCRVEREDYTPIIFFAALMLAHSIFEDKPNNLLEIEFWALQGHSESPKFVNAFEELKFNLFRKMEYRGFVEKELCDDVISLVPHDLWKRKRSPLHGGTFRSDIESDLYRGTCSSCRYAQEKIRKVQFFLKLDLIGGSPEVRYIDDLQSYRKYVSNLLHDDDANTNVNVRQ